MRSEGSTELLDSPVRGLSHCEKSLPVFGLLGQVVQFVGILFEIMKKFVIPLIYVADVLEPLSAETLEGGNTLGHCKVFVKGMFTPFAGALARHQTVETEPLVAFRNFHVRPFEEGGG